MPLTPEDVLNKHFSATQFRRGYDEQEVDDFLDEVVVELRRLAGENTELKRKVDSGDARASIATAAITAGVDPGQSEEEAAARIEAANARAERAEQDAQARIEAAERAAAERIAAAETARPETTEQPSAPATASVGTPVQDAAGVIALAQKVHDEYVEQGRQEHDRLVTSGREEHERLVGTARETSTQLVGEAEQRREQILGDLEQRRGTYDAKIQELSRYEGEYRTRLTSFIESHLEGLRDGDSVRPGDLPDAAVDQAAAADAAVSAVSASQQDVHETESAHHG